MTIKERVLRLLKNEGAIDQYDVWSLDYIFKASIEFVGYCHEWVYLDWAMMKIHLNISQDKLVVFCDNNCWEEK